MFTRYMQENDARLKIQEASTKNIETQIGQLTNLLTARAPGALPSDTEKNPREHINAITLRSRTKYEGPTQKEREVEAEEVVRKDKNVVEGIDHEEKVEHER